MSWLKTVSTVLKKTKCDEAENNAGCSKHPITHLSPMQIPLGLIFICTVYHLILEIEGRGTQVYQN